MQGRKNKDHNVLYGISDSAGPVYFLKQNTDFFHIKVLIWFLLKSPRQPELSRILFHIMNNGFQIFFRVDDAGVESTLPNGMTNVVFCS